jgi:hypothetical protein
MVHLGSALLIILSVLTVTFGSAQSKKLFIFKFKEGFLSTASQNSIMNEFKTLSGGRFVPAVKGVSGSYPCLSVLNLKVWEFTLPVYHNGTLLNEYWRIIERTKDGNPERTKGGGHGDDEVV